MNEYAEAWFELEFIFGAAINREVDSVTQDGFDWHELEQVALGGALSAGCTLLERARLRGVSKHVDLLFEFRDAFVHHGGDLTKNGNGRAFGDAEVYLALEAHRTISPEIVSPFFALRERRVVFRPNLLLAVRICLMQAEQRDGLLQACG